MMEQAGRRAASLHGHVEGFDRQMAIVDGADGPPHDEPGEQIEYDREVRFPVVPDAQLARAPDCCR